MLVVGAKQIGMSNVTKVARQLRLPDEKLLGDWIACVPGFALKKYRQLQRAQLSILSMNCFGGCVSKMLGLPFRSPFVNLWLNDEDFMKFLRAPRIYLEETPHFEKLTGSSDEAPDGYPLFSLGNISLNMMHYRTADEALSKWLERKQRINPYNLFVVMFTESEDIAREFDSLPFGKKICFVPFKSDIDSAWYLDPTKIVDKEQTIGRAVNHFGWGRVFFYDPFDMLLYGKKTPLIEM